MKNETVEKMQNVPTALQTLLVEPECQKEKNFYLETHRTRKVPDEALRMFLKASMDEVRIKWAQRYSAQLLTEGNIRDCVNFREAVMRREVTSDTSFPKQRDHTVHTLYNYLLGWYFILHVDQVKNVVKSHFLLRSGLDELKDSTLFEAFFNTWQWASLLHDIGYIFEGSFDPTKRDQVQDEKIKREVCELRGYFDFAFWEVNYRAFAHFSKQIQNSAHIWEYTGL
jgi:hypothetical protein